VNLKMLAVDRRDPAAENSDCGLGTLAQSL
jgi:hypothetical protein